MNPRKFFLFAMFAGLSCVSINATDARKAPAQDVMKKALVTTLRDKTSSVQEFRQANECLSYLLACEAANYLTTKEVTVDTVLAPAEGLEITNKIMLVPILRSGMAMLEPFLKFYPQARVGVVGLKRNEETGIAYWYYENVPCIDKDEKIIIIDPMFATGGTVSETIKLMIEKGAKEENILFVCIISAPEGIARIKAEYPKVNIVVAAEDEKLNENFYIVPGLGDYGDIYYQA